MISTSHLQAMPDKDSLRKLCKSIAVLEAIFSPDWESRYYSYNQNWSDGEEFFLK
ncbi:MAG: hypothetical protein LIP01_12150 [Tannerellaceae bacterium]|nr:hypothetical protein [Tannerellaceae bacterium]